MYWVVVYDAEPGSNWDLEPRSFHDYPAALEYAFNLAEKFYAVQDAPKFINLLFPDGSRCEWAVDALFFFSIALT